MVRRVLIMACLSLAVFAATAQASHRGGMSFGEAKQFVRASMSIAFDSSWDYGNFKKVYGCQRKTRRRVRCRVRWSIGDASFRGRVTVWHQGDGWRDDFTIVETNHYCLSQGGSDCTTVWVEK